MRLFIQPGEGVRPLVKAISTARKSVDIVIFRFDQREIEQALGTAVSRGVAVNALIASTNSAGEENLRKLEQRLLGAGVTVARTADDLIRYHSKYMIVDRRDLFLLAFNFTHADIERSRSFGLMTSSRAIVQEAHRLFEADVKRCAMEPGPSHLIVSPLNARKELTAFIKGAKKSLAMYDPQVSDHAMMRLLAERAKAGVEIRILGRVAGKINGVAAHKLPNMRLHTRTMIRDGKSAFVGSQSLREAELDSRRELGMIVKDPKTVAALVRTFQSDWAQVEDTTSEAGDSDDPSPAAKVAKKVAKALAREMPPMAPILDGMMQQASEFGIELIPDKMEQAVKGAVREAVKEAVRDAMEEALAAARTQ